MTIFSALDRGSFIFCLFTCILERRNLYIPCLHHHEFYLFIYNIVQTNGKKGINTHTSIEWLKAKESRARERDEQPVKTSHECTRSYKVIARRITEASQRKIEICIYSFECWKNCVCKIRIPWILLLLPFIVCMRECLSVCDKVRKLTFCTQNLLRFEWEGLNETSAWAPDANIKIKSKHIFVCYLHRYGSFWEMKTG